jgi:1-aminocyclopropane-1-carboxylate deaminase/D-cysteine desulfhydrase-like pyridoxal-dependent ACC family enzyme
VTAATGAVLGWRVVLVLSGDPPAQPTGNLARDIVFGADVRLIADRAARPAMMDEVADEMRRAGRRPFVISLGGSTPIGAAGMARAIAELSADSIRPDVIVHASSSAGTQSGVTAGCALFGLKTRVLGISVDEPAETLRANVERLVSRMAAELGARAETWLGSHPIDVDDSQVGDGYGIATPASEEALTLVARTEGIILDRVYESKAMAGLIARIRDGRFTRDQTVLFWHTGGLSE